MELNIDQPEVLREFAYAQGWLPRGVEILRLEIADAESAHINMRSFFSDDTTLIFQQPLSNGDTAAGAQFSLMVDAASALTAKEGHLPTLLGYAEEELILCLRDAD